MKYIYAHGFLSGPDSNKGQFLEQEFQNLNLNVIRPDLNGEKFENMTLSSQVKILSDIIEKYPREKFALIGSSLGAFLSLVIAEKYKQVERVVLMAPAFEFPERYIKNLDKQILAQWRENGSLPVFHHRYEKELNLSTKILDDAPPYYSFNFNRQFPVQIFHGLHDESVPYHLSIEYLKNHPMADVILLKSDHSLMDQIEVIWKYLRLYLNL